MTENQIKNMLSDIINNGAEYECRQLCGECDYRRKNCDDTCTMTDRLWNKYHLGEEIRSDYEYRKVIRYAVVKSDDKYLVGLKSALFPETIIYFESTSKKECEDWVNEHSNWINKNYGETDWINDDVDANDIRVDAIEDFCKELIQRVEGIPLPVISCEKLTEIIKEIGVKL